MKKNVNWPILNDVNASLLIKNELQWIAYVGARIYTILLLLFILLIFWWLSKNYYAHIYEHNYSYINIDSYYIFRYSYTLNPSILSYDTFYYNSNFHNIFINLIIRFPYNLINGWLMLALYLDNRPFDYAVGEAFYNLLYINTALKYWSYFLYLDKVSFAWDNFWVVCRWRFWPSFILYWTAEFHSFNHNFVLLKFFPRKDHYFILFMDALRPWFYLVILHSIYLYAYEEPFLVMPLDVSQLFCWGLAHGYSNLGSIMLWANVNNIKLLYVLDHIRSVTEFQYEYKHYYLIIWKEKLKQIYTQIIYPVFYPHISTLFISTIYLPIYLPVDSFNLWLLNAYNDVISWMFVGAYKLHVRIFNVNDLSFVSYIWGVYLKHNYILGLYSETWTVIWTFIQKLNYSQHFWYDYYIGQYVDTYWWSKKIKLEFYRFRYGRPREFYGFWSMWNFRNSVYYFLLYWFGCKVLFNIPSHYFYRDWWLYKVWWHSPKYIIDLFQVNSYITDDYMLSLDYFRPTRYQTYTDLLFNVVPLFYIFLTFYFFIDVLYQLELNIGFAAYILNCNSCTLLELSVVYLLFPYIIIMCVKLLGSIYLSFIQIINVLLLSNSTFIIWNLYSKINVNYLPLKYSQLILNQQNYLNLYFYFCWFREFKINTNYYLLDNKNYNFYWFRNESLNFDYQKPVIFKYSNDLSCFKPTNENYEHKLKTSFRFITFSNTKWLAMQINHFHMYYDYGVHHDPHHSIGILPREKYNM